MRHRLADSEALPGYCYNRRRPLSDVGVLGNYTDREENVGPGLGLGRTEKEQR